MSSFEKRMGDFKEGTEKVNPFLYEKTDINISSFWVLKS
jgi:hypothetical protein